jgi:hypothetical protein
MGGGEEQQEPSRRSKTVRGLLCGTAGGRGNATISTERERGEEDEEEDEEKIPDEYSLYEYAPADVASTQPSSSCRLVYSQCEWIHICMYKA